METLLFTLNLVTPIFIIVFLGYFLRKLKLIDDSFSRKASKLVFSVCLPALIFIQLSGENLIAIINVKQLVFCYVGMILFYIFFWLVAARYIKNRRDQGPFIQGSFRSNYGVIGLAFAALMMTGAGMAKAALLLAVIIPLNNVLAVVALTLPTAQESTISKRKTLLAVFQNPMIVATIVSLPFSLFAIPVPEIMQKTGDYLAAMTLPLALLAIGGTLDIHTLRKDNTFALLGSFFKIILQPLVMVPVAIILGFRNDDLLLIFLLFATPSAVAGYIMADAMGCNARLAGNIVLISTAGAVVTMAAGIFLLKSLHYI